MTALLPTPRKLDSWIESYQKYTNILPSPELFRKWVGIFFVAAAMERRYWVRTMGSNLYPNLYVILVGPPGIGKGQAIHPGEAMLRQVPNMKVGPSDMTAASLIDSLNEAVRHVILRGNPPFLQYNSLCVVSRELGVLIPGWDNAFMNNLTDIYDGYQVDQKRRGKDLHIKIKDPQINLLAACTPSYLNEVLPAGAWDQGFISRTLLVYSGDRVQRDPFAEVEVTQALTELGADLLHDLKAIGYEDGQISFTPEAVKAMKAWIDGGCDPQPNHTKLQYYNSRRIAHLLKLCQVASLSRSGAKIITLEHYREAMGWLMEAETYMPDIFKSMVQGGDSAAMEEAWHYTWKAYTKEKNRPLAQHRIIHFLRDRVPAHSLLKVLNIMVESRMLEIVISEKGTMQGYRPIAPEQRHVEVE
jgi:hypothetical protein